MDTSTITIPSEQMFAPAQPPIPPALHAWLMGRRSLLIQELGQLEELLGMPRSIVPRRKRGRDE
jgi:hypothetical protein